MRRIFPSIVVRRWPLSFLQELPSPSAHIEKTVGAEGNVASVVMDGLFMDREQDALGIGIERESAVARGEFREV